MRAGRIHIVVGVIFNSARDRILIARRPEYLSHGGFWEFPGGKRENGEGVEAALRRELREELNLTVERATPMFRIDHDYPEGGVTLDVWQIEEWSGDVHGREGQMIEWVAVGDLRDRAFPAANLAIIRWLNLPSLYLITPDLPCYDGDFLARLEALLTGGVKLLQFRSTRLPEEERRPVLERIVALCSRHEARVLVNGSPAEAAGSGAHGVHLNSTRLAQLHERPLDSDHLVAASVHDSVEMAHAVRLNVDLAVVGPVRATQTHPGARLLGWQGFGAIAASGAIPVYAIGGMQPVDLDSARQHGARGLAIIRGIWESGDPVAAARACLE